MINIKKKLDQCQFDQNSDQFNFNQRLISFKFVPENCLD